ncbi:MAG TPA: hypothetical protein VL738_40420 [Dactylosporangium sp.]|nr:hypothetical protein [Dactylosporangium sp.]
MAAPSGTAVDQTCSKSATSAATTPRPVSTSTPALVSAGSIGTIAVSRSAISILGGNTGAVRTSAPASVRLWA